MSSSYKNDPLSVNDMEISLDTKSDNNDAIVKKNTVLDNLKKGPKLLYNSTIGELKNGRIPILDSAYRAVYRKSYNPNNSKGTDVFQKSEGYYRLGGKYGSRRKRKNKTRQKKNKTIKNKNKTNKNKK
jgi:hypothetical protein